MKAKYLFILLTADILAAAVMLGVLPADKVWWLFLPLVLAVVIMILLCRSVIKPATVATRGMELISEQDFNNRLTKVGEYNADKVVALFNAMIEKLHGERLRNLEQDSFLRLLVQTSPMGVMTLDFDGKVSMINNSMLRIFGMKDESEALGKDLAALPTDMAPKMTAIPHGENMIIRRGDVRMYRCFHLSFIQTGFRRRFYLLENLTEEVMKAERQAYEKVIRIISHEVNNTMGGVKSVLGLLQDTVDDPEIKEVIESCDDRCEMMCGFIRAYADVVKVPAPVKRRVDLHQELEAMTPFLKELAGTDISLTLNDTEEELTVDLDIAQIQQVVVNIVRNAVDSITDKGNIDISTGGAPGRVWMEVANDGEPISEEVSHKLFSPFFSTKKEGRGLGLTLISEILRRHEARFSLLTGSDGITRFKIDFPTLT